MSGALIPYPTQQHQHRHNGSQCQLICGGCSTLLVYPYGSNHVRCALCSFVTSVPPQGMQVAHVSCGGCGVTLMYPGEAHAVRCASCRYITVLTSNREQGSETQTVIVENPMTLDDSGRLVSCVSVGVRTKQ